MWVYNECRVEMVYKNACPHLATPFLMMTRIEAMLSHSGLRTLQFSMMLLRILLGFYSVYNFSYLSRMKSV